ncbi:MAG: hypothetical protein K0R26_1247 [Bacteroidota bacterium]|jgi:hypothetical protein|nr:hypothetical protein [Bacteroidota bacterium]
MKKIILLAAVVTVASFTSCKKEKTCSCTVSVSNSNTSNYPNPTSTTTIEYKYGKMKKGDAIKVCPTSETEVVNNNVSGTFANTKTTTTACTIK